MRRGWQDIADVCRQHNRKSFFDDGEGLVGVYNHRNVVMWYRWSEGGYALVGETDTPQGAKLVKLSSSLTVHQRVMTYAETYTEQKKHVVDAVLFFRMGDFYETFYDDAILCSKVLGLALTTYNKGADNQIPMAGIPYRAIDAYRKKLVASGHRVVLFEHDHAKNREIGLE